MQCLLIYRTRSDHNWRHIWNCFSLPSRPLDPTILQLPKLKLFKKMICVNYIKQVL